MLMVELAGTAPALEYKHIKENPRLPGEENGQSRCSSSLFLTLFKDFSNCSSSCYFFFLHWVNTKS